MRQVRLHLCVTLLALATLSCGPSGQPTTVLDTSQEAAFGSAHPIGIPVGPFHLPTGQFNDTIYTGTFRVLTPDSAIAIMEEAEANFFDLFVNLAGSRDNYQNPDGTFCLSCFKARLDEFAGINFTPYVTFGTVRGHILFDEPHDSSNWGGYFVSYEDIDSAASYSRQLFPSMPVGVGGPPTWLIGGAPYAKLDFGFAQYTTKRGGVMGYRINEVAAGRAAGLGVVFSLNILGGNEGGPMTAPQVRQFGKVLACEPFSQGLLMWKYDAVVMGDSAMREAIDDVVRVANKGEVLDPACWPGID